MIPCADASGVPAEGPEYQCHCRYFHPRPGQTNPAWHHGIGAKDLDPEAADAIQALIDRQVIGKAVLVG